MIRIAYVYDCGDVHSRIPSGIDCKVFSQVKVMNTRISSCELVCPKRLGPFAGLVQALPFIRDRTKWESLVLAAFDVIYVRKPRYFSKQFISFLEYWKKKGKMVLLEIPTYPYDGEMLNPKLLTVYLKDRIYRNQLSGKIDRMFVCGHFSPEVFGIPAIGIMNGVDLGGITVRTPSLKESSIDMICVAAFFKWHGIDRLLRGLARYREANGGKRIGVHLVGDGPEIPHLQRLARNLSVDESVFFYGQCDRSQMDSIYDKCTLAVESLGVHRRGPNSISSSLKSREYLAKGIPFVYSTQMDVFLDEPVDFCLKVSEDEDPIDFKQIVAFHDWLYSKYQEDQLIERIREYAIAHVSMDTTMKPVIDYIMELESGQ